MMIDYNHDEIKILDLGFSPYKKVWDSTKKNAERSN
jgi:hypothetical protein